MTTSDDELRRRAQRDASAYRTAASEAHLAERVAALRLRMRPMSDAADAEEDPNDRAMRIFREEEALCERFVVEFGGELNSKGTRYRVMIYAETIRKIFEYTRYLRDEAISAQTQADERP